MLQVLDFIIALLKTRIASDQFFFLTNVIAYIKYRCIAALRSSVECIYYGSYYIRYYCQHHRIPLR